MEWKKQWILRDLYDEWYENWTKALRGAWYDWVIIKENWNITEWVVFEPEQIKSATDNVWTFDKNNPDIRYQLTPEELRAWEEKWAKKIWDSDHWPVYEWLKGNDAVDFLLWLEDWEVKWAFNYKWKDVDLIWGWYNSSNKEWVWLKKIAIKHPSVLHKIQDMMNTIPQDWTKSNSKKIVLNDPSWVVVIRLDWDWEAKRWLMTAYDK
jgi:hypothetical protein